MFQTKDLDGLRSPDGAGGASAAAAFRTQVLGDDDEAVRDLQWLAEFAGGARATWRSSRRNRTRKANARSSLSGPR